MDSTSVKQPTAGHGYVVNLKQPIDGFTKLHRASYLGYQDEVRNALKTIPVNAKDAEKRTALHLAASAGNTIIVRLLMERDLNFNEGDSFGKTAIMKAIEGSHKETIRAMIAKGVSLTASDRNGNNAMHIALLEGHYDVAKLMLQYFPNLNVGNTDGVNPFHILVDTTQVKLARKFIDHGASVNIEDKRKRTPLMLACKKGCFPMVSMLLKNGANPEAKDSNGWTALDYASIMGHTQVKNILQAYINGEVPTKKEESESSSSSEEEEEEIVSGRGFFSESLQRIVPIRMESQSMFLKRINRPLIKAAVTEKQDEGVRGADGKLFPMPDVIAAMQMQANKLGDIHTWLLHHQKVTEQKRKEYEELKGHARKLWDQRNKLLEKEEERKKKLKDLIEKHKKVLNIKEADCLQEQICVLRDGLSELKEEHDKAVAERDELQIILERGRGAHKSAGASLAEKTTQLLKENEMLYDKLNEIQSQARGVTDDLTIKCKTADDLVKHLKTVLRGTCRLLEEKHSEMDKVMSEVDGHQFMISSTKDNFNTIKEENMKVGKNIDEVDVKMKSIRKYLAKIHKEMEKYSLTKSLVEAGVITLDGKAKKVSSSTSEVIKKKKKGGQNELEPEPEVSSLADEKYNLTELMSPTSSVPTVCQTTLDMVKYSWLADDEDQGAVTEEDLELLLNKTIRDTTQPEEQPSTEEPAEPEEENSNEALPPHLQAKLASVAAKYSR